MRRIITAEEKAKRDKKRARMLSVLMLIIMLGSTAGFAFISYQQDQQPQQALHGQGQGQLQETANGWLFRFQGQQLLALTSPATAADVPVEISTTIEQYAGETLYIDAESEAVVNELATTIGRYALRVQQACSGVCERDLPEINCTQGNLLVWKAAENNMVSEEERCVFIEGDMRAVDAFIYRVFGVQ